MDFPSQNLTVPAGKLLFAEYKTGTKVPGGARFFGNCPEFTLSAESSNLDHYSSTGGLRNLDASVPLNSDLNGAIRTDDIKPENMRYWFMGKSRSMAVTSGTAVTETFTGVNKGDFLQVGVTATNPIGVGKLSSVSVKAGAGAGTTLVEFQDYEVDLESGLIAILQASTITADTQINVTYANAAYTFQEIRSGSSAVEGELRFYSDNPYGPNRRLVIPRVRLTPSGDLSFLTDPESPSWMELSFAARVMKKGTMPMIINADGLPFNGIA